VIGRFRTAGRVVARPVLLLIPREVTIPEGRQVRQSSYLYRAQKRQRGPGVEAAIDREQTRVRLRSLDSNGSRRDVREEAK
jgi:hypothetical protein